MESTYRQYKENVLKDYDGFVKMIDEIRQGKETPYDHSMEQLEKQATNIRKDRFMLMVVGEAKSGKSTFINAYLKKNILPMDVKQCTNAIVEIKDGEKYRLTATYADGRTTVLDDESEIRNFMAANAAMDDDYRGIPVSLINNELLMKWQDRPAREEDIRDLLKNVPEDNIYRLKPEEYEFKIRTYISKRKSNWRKLVKTITIEYPFEDKELKGIEILDTPGVNAEGKVGDITNQFVENANAVMFLKPVTGQALEATSFKKFLNSKSADRNRNAMFLVLTRAANETEQHMGAILQEAFRQFGNINEHQIIPVDSKAELFANSIEGLSSDELKQKLMELKANKEIDSFLLLPWFESNGDKDKYLEEVRQLSNFMQVRDALNIFAHKAEYLALSELLSRMLIVLEQSQAITSDSVKNLELKAEDPQELNRKLQAVKQNLEDLQLKINKTVDEISDRYSLPGGEIEKKILAELTDYEVKVNTIDADSRDSVDELEKITYQKVDCYKDLVSQLQKQVVSECEDVLISCSQDAEIDYRIFKPDLTKEEIANIEKSARVKATGTEEYTEEKGSCCTYEVKKQRSVFSQSKYFKLCKKGVYSRIEQIKNVASSFLQDFVVRITAVYREELRRNLKLQKKEYDELIQSKQSADELQELIRKGREHLAKLKGNEEKIRVVKGGIDKYVA